MKKPYEKPEIETEPAFEILQAGCTYNDPSTFTTCDPDFGFYVGHEGCPI